ncbi:MULTISPECIES: plasmid replication protein RepC [unclassified Ensifer]|uniref:plasmid replication protein RepC n=1 Tax=unclassified Ensifer TaxID=2633371 RepID=UPI0008131C8B|nr:MULTISPECIES: plasmid replication protein RepC [unclassified Ensifer]OCP23591.1 hypothetical protein BC363_24480 [Ensifer sp. LC384]OCP24278.1 hypothetical protein BC361_20960 [Ensifer sp. LC54]
MKQSGWRKPTPGLCRANILADDGERAPTSKSRAMLAVRRVAPVIGVRPGDLMLLDTLVAFTSPPDWEEGARPIVWPSNEYLIHHTGYSLSAIKRHLRNLAEMGLIAYKDSSNGKRWGRRGDDGRIVEAYGLDLSPLAARSGEFETLYASVRAQRNLTKELKRKITIFRRIVWAILQSDYARQPDDLWCQIRQRYEALAEALACNTSGNADLSSVCDAFEALKNEAEEKLRNVEPESPEENSSTGCFEKENHSFMDPTGAALEPHIQPTNHLQSVRCKSIENAPARSGPAERTWNVGKNDDIGNTSVPPRETERNPATAAPPVSVGDVTIRSVVFACPAFAEMAHGIDAYIRSWRDFVTVADKIRSMIGISGDAWAAAQAAIGSEAAAVAVALITDKYSEGKVVSPGGYLRGLVLKAQKGDLNLARSVFGRMNERHGKAEG